MRSGSGIVVANAFDKTVQIIMYIIDSVLVD